jgi:2-oxoglutarate ferredoxin oxidoreductase subunit alpha
MPGSEVGIIYFGSTEPAVFEARRLLAEAGVSTDAMRVRAVPFTREMGEFIQSHSRNYVVEMNRDGQLFQLLTLEYSNQAGKILSLAHTDGLPLTARRLLGGILTNEEKLK